MAELISVSAQPVELDVVGHWLLYIMQQQRMLMVSMMNHVVVVG